MTLYICSITLSMFLIYIVNRMFYEKKGLWYWAASIISILPTSIIAGIRDFTVGTDIRHYVVPNFNAALSYDSLFSFMRYMKTVKTAFVNSVNHTESGYSVLTYLVSRMSGDAHWLLFVLQFLTVLFIYLGLVRFNRKNLISITFGMFIYYMFFYGQSLNIMRQTLAASMVFLAVSFLIENKFVISILIILAASEFHMSALIGLLYILLFWKLVHGRRNTPMFDHYPYEKLIVLIGTFSVMFIFGPYLFKMLGFVVTHISQLSKYIPSIAVSSIEGYKFIGTFLFVLTDFIVIGLVSGYRMSNEFESSPVTKLFFMSILGSVILYTIYKFQVVIPRLAIYFSILRIIVYPYYIKNMNYLRVKRMMQVFLVISLVFLFLYNLKSGNGQIYPYTTSVLKHF